MITEDYVSFEIAKKLDSLQAEFETDKFYSPEGRNLTALDDRDYRELGYVKRPSLQMAMKWLREKYTIHIEIEAYYCEDGRMWLAKIQRIESANTILVKTCMCNKTHEEAVEKAIKYCLTNLI